MQILAAAAAFLVVMAVVSAIARHSPAPLAGRSRGRARGGGQRRRRSLLVTAAKAAGLKLASDHLLDAAAELVGRGAGRMGRWSGRRVGRGWQHVTDGARRRWQARSDSVRAPLFFTRHRPASTPDDADPAEPAPPPPDGTQQPQPAEPEPAHHPDPAPRPDAATTAPTGAGRKTATMRHRYAINLEPPATDAEFLESCVDLGDVLRSLAEQIGEWADGLSGLNLPQSVLSPLQAVGDGIEEAADGAARAAAAFCDEFEDAREVASRGMHITGQDAA